MSGLRDRAASFWRSHLGPNLIGDVRSTIVGAVIGMVTGVATTAWTVGVTVEHFVRTNDEGYAQPFPPLVEQLQEDDKKASVRFEPADLADAYVCESAYVNGGSYREVFLGYVSRYAMCWDLGQVDTDSFVVRPNRLSGALQQRDGGWLCKCASAR